MLYIQESRLWYVVVSQIKIASLVWIGYNKYLFLVIWLFTYFCANIGDVFYVWKWYICLVGIEVLLFIIIIVVIIIIVFMYLFIF